ncbi:hypothetical protein SRRS_44980 [Sporomusa rhizae]
MRIDEVTYHRVKPIFQVIDSVTQTALGVILQGSLFSIPSVAPFKTKI